MPAGIKANSDGSAAIQVGGTDVITLTSGGAATFVTSPTTVQAGTAAAPSITFSGDTNTGIYSPGADTIAFTEGGIESMRITSAGEVLVGGTTAISADSGCLSIQRAGVATLNLFRNDTTVSSTNVLGSIAFYGNDTTANAVTNLAYIQAVASGDHAAGDNPTDLVFATTPDGSATVAEAMRLTQAGNLGLGVTPSAWGSTYKVAQVGNGGAVYGRNNSAQVGLSSNYYNDGTDKYLTTAAATAYVQSAGSHLWYNAPSGTAGNAITFTQAMTLDASGNLLVATTGTTAVQSNTAGAMTYRPAAQLEVNGNATQAAFFGRTNDGMIVGFYESGTREGDISVSGTTVSYNGGHLSRYAQTQTAKDESLLKGTVLSNLDEMNVYTDADGNPVENEQLNKVKVSDVEGDVNVAGVFVNWSYDEQHQVDEINMAMTGDMIIRIAQGVTVQKGDLLMSAGDGTAKPQGDDIVRSKTVAKVTSNHVTCTYEDGSYCVPCVLMAC